VRDKLKENLLRIESKRATTILNVLKDHLIIAAKRSRIRELKILVFTEYLPPKLGSDRRIFEIMKRLLNRHEVHFAVFPPLRQLVCKLPEKEARDSHSQQECNTVKYEGINGHFFAISPKVVMMWQHSMILAFRSRYYT
jgi:hypothetical protein